MKLKGSINKKMYLFPPGLFRIKLRSQPFKLETLIFFKNRINKTFWLKVKKQIEIKFPAKNRWKREREKIDVPYYPDYDSDD